MVLDMLLVIDEATELIAHYQSTTAYNILALAYKKIGNYEQAKTIYERLVHNSENTLFGKFGDIIHGPWFSRQGRAFFKMFSGREKFQCVN